MLREVEFRKLEVWSQSRLERLMATVGFSFPYRQILLSLFFQLRVATVASGEVRGMVCIWEHILKYIYFIFLFLLNLLR